MKKIRDQTASIQKMLPWWNEEVVNKKNYELKSLPKSNKLLIKKISK